MLALEPYLSERTHIIWDWNGTLLNDMELCVEIVSEQLTAHGLEALTPDRYRRLFRMPIRNYYTDLGFPVREDEETFERIARQWINAYAARVSRCPLFQGAKDLLHRLQHQGKRQAILSASEQNHLRELVRRHGIESHFDAIFGLGDIYARSKIEPGRELLDAWKAPREGVVLVGDMDHDLEVGKALGIDVLLLGDGHQLHTGPALAHPLRVECRFTGRS